MAYKLKAMSGSTLIVLSLQYDNGEQVAVRTVQYKTSESEWITWTGDSQDITPTHPYKTYWYWVNQHWQLVMDNLDASTEYTIKVTINGSTTLPEITISTCALPPLWDIQISPSVTDVSKQAKVQASIDNLASWRATAQAVGCAPLRTLYFDYSNQTGVRASCGFSSSMTVCNTPIAISHYDYQVVYHELRHYFGACGNGGDVPRGSEGFLDGSVTNASIPNRNGMFTAANESEWGCHATYTNAAKDGIYYKKGNDIYSKLDGVFQFKTGSDLAHYHIVNSHDCNNDFINGSTLEILNWFMLRAMMFNNISIVTVNQ